MTIKKEMHIINKNKRVYIYYGKVHVATLKNVSDGQVYFEALLMDPSSHIFHALNFKLDPGEAPPFAGHRGSKVGKIKEEQKNLYSKIGLILRENREKVGLSLSHVAAKLGITLVVLQKTEAGSRRISQSEIRLLCNLYRTDTKPLIDLLVQIEEME